MPQSFQPTGDTFNLASAPPVDPSYASSGRPNSSGPPIVSPSQSRPPPPTRMPTYGTSATTTIQLSQPNRTAPPPLPQAYRGPKTSRATQVSIQNATNEETNQQIPGIAIKPASGTNLGDAEPRRSNTHTPTHISTSDETQAKRTASTPGIYPSTSDAHEAYRENTAPQKGRTQQQDNGDGPLSQKDRGDDGQLDGVPRTRASSHQTVYVEGAAVVTRGQGSHSANALSMEVDRDRGDTPSYNNLYPQTSEKHPADGGGNHDNRPYPAALSPPSLGRTSTGGSNLRSIQTMVVTGESTTRTYPPNSPTKQSGSPNTPTHARASTTSNTPTAKLQRSTSTQGRSVSADVAPSAPLIRYSRTMGGTQTHYADTPSLARTVSDESPAGGLGKSQTSVVVTNDSVQSDAMANKVSNGAYASREHYNNARTRAQSIISANPDVIVCTLSGAKKSGVVSAHISWLLTTHTSLYGGGTFEIRRKYSDFTWLHNSMEANHFELMIPSIPAEASAMQKQDAYFVNKREIGLQIFVDRCCRHERIRELKAFSVFVTGSDAELKSLKKPKLLKPLKVHRGGNMRREPKLKRAKEYLDGLEKHLRVLIEASSVEMKLVKSQIEAAKGRGSYYDTYRAMGDAQMAGGYLHASFRTLADTLQTNEAESGGKLLAAVQDYRSGLKSLHNYALTACAYVQRVFDYQDTLNYWLETLDEMEKMQSRKQVSKQGLMASGADLETSKVDKDIGLVESKMAAAYQELNVTQSLVDKISEAYWGEIMSFDYLKDQDLRSIHVSRIHAWAETYDGTLGALTTAMKTLQTPVSREHRSIQ